MTKAGLVKVWPLIIFYKPRGMPVSAKPHGFSILSFFFPKAWAVEESLVGIQFTIRQKIR